MSAWRAPSHSRLFAALDATWPAHARHSKAPWILRNGAGGGQRVSAATHATPAEPVSRQAVDRAERDMRAMQQAPLFMIRKGEDDLDEMLAQRGYGTVDPVAIYAAWARDLALDAAAGMTAIHCLAPLAIMEEIWARGGIGPGRLAVMARVQGPKIYLLARRDDRPVGVVFVACDGNIAMLHALEVDPRYRRMGIGRYLSAAAATWAAEQGAQTLALLAVQTNAAAMGLYRDMGMAEVAQYHYRKKQPEQDP